jgi:hypothetical protein
MPSVAPLVNVSCALPAPTTRRAHARVASSSARARKPAAWLLLGWPKVALIASAAALAAAGSTGDVALALR